MSELVEKLFRVHDALTNAGLAHAFGGAIALAYCVEEPRGTRDLDVNIFTPAPNAPTAFEALPDGIGVSAGDVEAAIRDGQVRLWWDETPIDVFLNSHPVHDAAAAAILWVPLLGREIPVLDCATLVVFKALYDRTKDWADIESVAERSPADIDRALEMVNDLVGPDTPISERLRALIRSKKATGRQKDLDVLDELEGLRRQQTEEN